MRLIRDIYFAIGATHIPIGQLVFQTSLDGHAVLPQPQIQDALNAAADAFRKVIDETDEK